jgi:hypothetical protein
MAILTFVETRDRIVDDLDFNLWLPYLTRPIEANLELLVDEGYIQEEKGLRFVSTLLGEDWIDCPAYTLKAFGGEFPPPRPEEQFLEPLNLEIRKAILLLLEDNRVAKLQPLTIRDFYETDNVYLNLGQTLLTSNLSSLIAQARLKVHVTYALDDNSLSYVSQVGYGVS